MVSAGRAVGVGRSQLRAAPDLSAVSAATSVVSPTVTKIPLMHRYSASDASGAGLSRRATVPFGTLGVTWRGRSAVPGLEIAVRTRQDGHWSGWRHLDSDTGDDPVATGVVRGGTDPLYVGPSDGVQVRVESGAGRLPRGMRLELVDPGERTDDVTVTSGPHGGWDAATASQPVVLTRAQWGADESQVRCPAQYTSTVRAGILHHTAGTNGYSAADVPAILRGDYAYHLSRGWCDIGYNALVDRFGRIWEGRAGGLDRAVIGAHAGGFNTGTFGVAMIGNYDVAAPSSASITAVARFMAWKLGMAHRDPQGSTVLTSAGGGTARYPAGARVRLPVVMGHRDTGWTACPGRHLYPALPRIRAQATRFMQAALINPSVPRGAIEQGDVVSLTARAMRRQRWRLDVDAPCGGGQVARIRGSVAAHREIQASWNGLLPDGSPARPGRYRLTLRSSSATGPAVPVSTDVLIVPGPQPVQASAVPTGGSGRYVAVAPVRLHDSRDGGGLGPGGYVRVPVLGRAGVPAAGVTAVVLNLTASCTSTDTALTLFPSGSPSSRPVSAIPAGVTRSVLATTRVGADGSVTVRNARGVSELTVDLVGYFTDLAGAGSRVRAVEGTRILDTRVDGGPLENGQARTVTLPDTVGGLGRAGITGVVVDLSAVGPSGAGALSLGSSTLPALTYRGGETVDNLAIVPVSGGRFTVRAAGARTRVIMDVRAVLSTRTGGTLSAVKPVLLTEATLRPRTPKKITVTGDRTGVPDTASAVLVTLTAVDADTSGALNAYPWGSAGSTTAALRATADRGRANQVLVPVGRAGAIALFAAGGPMPVRVDVIGYVS